MGIVYVLVAVLGAAIAVFGLQNLSPVVIRFLGWQIEGALSLVVLLSILAGVVLASLCGLLPHWRLRSRIRQLENQLAQRPPLEAPRTDQRTP
jgi:uncharacterized integral membrane protein